MTISLRARKLFPCASNKTFWVTDIRDSRYIIPQLGIWDGKCDIPGHVLVYYKTSRHVLVYCETSHRCCSKFQAGVPCIISSVLVHHVPSPNSLGYCVPSKGMYYWYILGQNSASCPEFGPLGHCHLLSISNRGPKKIVIKVSKGEPK